MVTIRASFIENSKGKQLGVFLTAKQYKKLIKKLDEKLYIEDLMYQIYRKMVSKHQYTCFCHCYSCKGCDGYCRCGLPNCLCKSKTKKKQSGII